MTDRNNVGITVRDRTMGFVLRGLMKRVCFKIMDRTLKQAGDIYVTVIYIYNISMTHLLFSELTTGYCIIIGTIKHGL